MLIKTRFWNFYIALQKYLEFYDRIYNLRAGEARNLAEDLIKFCEDVKWDVCAVLILISNAAECKLILLAEYWELFKIFFDNFNIKPYLYFLNYHIAILYSKEYKLKVIDVLFEELPTHLSNYRNMTIEELLNVYEPNTVMHHIFHDNIEGFLECVDIFDENSYKVVFENKSLIEWCCFYGSVKIFRYLRNLNVAITKECISSSFIGRNAEIIQECTHKNPDVYIQQNDKLLKINNLEFLLEFHSEYIQNLSNLEVAGKSMNIKEFLIAASLSNKPNEYFYFSIYFGIPELVEYLFKFAEVDIKISFKRTALLLATTYNFPETIKMLINLGADVNQIDGYKNALFYAVEYDAVESFDLLVNNGADFYYKLDGNHTLLMTASLLGRISLIRRLVKLGLNVNEREGFGKTPLTFAAMRNQSEAASLLVELGANLELKDVDGYTPLMEAAYLNHADCVARLIELGADNSGIETAQNSFQETMNDLELQLAMRLSMEKFED